MIRAALPKAFASASIALALPAAALAQGLFVDFNSTTQDGGPHNEPGYQPYNAGHEVAADFITQSYPAFGTTITLTPSWPDTIDNRVQQMIDRGDQQTDPANPAGNDASYDGEMLNLMTDWIGVDTRTGNGGNGDGVPTSMQFLLQGLPAETYRWTSFHHDTEFVNGVFTVEVTDADGTRTLGPFEMTASSPGGNVNDNFENPGAGNDPHVLSSTTSFLVASDGASDVTVTFRTTGANGSSELNIHNQLFGVNGFELVVNNDADNDGMHDDYEEANGLNPSVDDADLDADEDGSTNFEEFTRRTDPQNPDTDGDGLEDGVETDTGTWTSTSDTGTDPLEADTDGDSIPDGIENFDLPYLSASQPGTNPHQLDTDADGFSDWFEIREPTNPTDPAAFPVGLFIDFSNGGNQAGGPQEAYSYQSFIANHEIAADFTAVRTFSAFGAGVDLAVTFPDSTAETVQQMINRADGFNVNYDGALVDVVRDWIGVDARAGSGGNGMGVFTSITLTLSGLPPGTYSYRSYHHDTEYMHSAFEIEAADADGVRPAGSFTMTNSSINTTTALTAENPGPGNGPEVLSSTAEFEIFSDGVTPVTITYRAQEGANVHNSFVGINGLEIRRLSDAVPAFRIREISLEDDNITLVWDSRPGALYSVFFSFDLQSWLGEVADNVASQGDETSFTFPNLFPGEPTIYFQIRKQ